MVFYEMECTKARADWSDVKFEFANQTFVLNLSVSHYSCFIKDIKVFFMFALVYANL